MIYKSIPGWFDFEAFYDLMIQTLNKKEYSTFVEIGVWKGRSTAYMAERIKDTGAHIDFYAIDTFEGSPNERLHQKDPDIRTLHQVALTNLHDLLGYVTVVKKSSLEAVENFKQVDFVFIDATHTYDAVKADLAAWMPKIKPGGFIAGHDYDWKEVARAVDEILPNRTLFPKTSVWYQQL